MKSFAERIHDKGEAAMGEILQEGLNYYARYIKAAVDAFPVEDAPIYLAAMKSVHDASRNMMPGNGAKLEDHLLEHMTAIVIPIRRQK